MFAINLAPYIKVPTFIMQSLYDTWSIKNILGIPCIQGTTLAYCGPNQKTIIEEYHRNLTNTIF